MADKLVNRNYIIMNKLNSKIPEGPLVKSGRNTNPR